VVYPLKTWQALVMGILLGLLVAALILIVSVPPRREALMILPTKTIAPFLVHITGAVASPGVYSVQPGSRVADIITLAGGSLPDANVDALNLAAPLSDGVKIYVPYKGEAVYSITEVPLAEGVSDSSESPINLNKATVEQLEALPGIGRTKAEAIVQYREAHGNFDTIEQVQDVPGIGPTIFAQIRDRITVAP